MARRIKRPKVVWLPPSNTNHVGQLTTVGNTVFIVDAVGAAGATAVGEVPVVNDVVPDQAAGNFSLSDIENSGYRLRRIVGKIWLFSSQDDAANAPATAIVTAGLIVRRVDPVTQISLAFNAGLLSVAPNMVENWADPWIWRRSWYLTNQDNADTRSGLGINLRGMTANWQAGSVMDGPHVDAKTARVVGPEERLFLDVAVTIDIPGGGDQARPFSVRVVTDLRCLASMRTTSGNRRNASR